MSGSLRRVWLILLSHLVGSVSVVDELDRLIEIERETRRLDASRARILAQLEADRTCDLEHGMRTGAWWAREAGLKHAECQRTTKISVQLAGRFTVLLDAVETGTISWAHARFICNASNDRITDAIVELQGAFIELAGHMTFPAWEHEVRAIIDNLDRDGGHDPDRERSSRAHLSPTFGGSVLKGWFTDDLSVPMNEAIEDKTDQLFHKYTANRDVCSELAIPTRAELRALAIAELVALGAATNWAKARPTRPECTLVLNPDTSQVTASDGTILSPTATALLLNDPMWRFLRFDQQGSILDYGRSERLAPPPLRQALAVRDGGCIFPGCDIHSGHCDAHHVIHWNHNGTTDPDNTALLCRFHHGVTHRNRWTMTAIGGQRFQWTTPTGQIINSQRHHRQLQPHGA